MNPEDAEQRFSPEQSRSTGGHGKKRFRLERNSTDQKVSAAMPEILGPRRKTKSMPVQKVPIADEKIDNTPRQEETLKEDWQSLFDEGQNAVEQERGKKDEWQPLFGNSKVNPTLEQYPDLISAQANPDERTSLPTVKSALANAKKKAAETDLLKSHPKKKGNIARLLVFTVLPFILATGGLGIAIALHLVEVDIASKTFSINWPLTKKTPTSKAEEKHSSASIKPEKKNDVSHSEKTPKEPNAPTESDHLTPNAAFVGWFGEETPANMLCGEKRGEYFWPADQSVMVYVPQGEFWHKKNNSKFVKTELPAYYIDKYELSNGQYREYLMATGRKPAYTVKPEFRRPEQPACGISWKEARKYAKWAKKRLPTELEWEKAARGGVKIPDWKSKTVIALKANPYPKRRYPWGNDIPGFMLANYKSRKDKYSVTAPVDTFDKGQSPYGCLNMAGNVWEWCTNKHPTKSAYLCMGGSYNSKPTKMFYRLYPKKKRSSSIGLRFVYSPDR